MTSEGLGKMFEGDSADTCAGKYPLMSMGDQAEGLSCADPEARTPISASGNFHTKTFPYQDILIPRHFHTKIFPYMVGKYLGLKMS